MSHQLNKRSILRKTAQVGGLTLGSRVLGVVREFLQIKFLGVGALSDAFIVAFRIPNLLRKIFAEGALSAAFVPMYVKLMKNDEVDRAHGLMSGAFVFFEGVVLLLCILVYFKAATVVSWIAPGFSTEQLSYAVPFLQLLFPFILFISGSALLAGALQSVNHFFIPAFGPVLLNIVWVSALLLCLYYQASPYVLCVCILGGGILQFILHLVWYFSLGFRFGAIDSQSREIFKGVLKKFGHCLFGMSIIEVNLFVDTIIASFLPKGSVSLLYYGARFMGIPLGIFAIAFSTILLSHFSRVALYAPRRLNFYLLEASKLVCWVVIPATIFLMLIAENLFKILFISRGNSQQMIWQAKWILIIMASGLVFFSLNKIFTNVFYALNDTWTPTVAGIIATLVNVTINLASLFFLGEYAIFGIAASTVLAGVVLSVLCVYFLHTKYAFHFYIPHFWGFIVRYTTQVLVGMTIFYSVYQYLISATGHRVIHAMFDVYGGYWIMALLSGLTGMIFLFTTGNLFKVKLYFLK